jgi:hypothetical protein
MDETQQPPHKGLPPLGSKVLLEGEGGTGKTTSLRTAAEAPGIEGLFGIFTDAGMVQATASPKVHYKYISPAGSSWKELRNMAQKSNQLGAEGLIKVDGEKQKFTQALQVIDTCNRFVCDCHGEDFGDAAEWGTDRILAIDNLTGFSKMSRYLLVGARTAMSLPEIYNAQGNAGRFLDYLAMEIPCHFILVAHIAQDRDEFTARVTTYPDTPGLGNKLRPLLSPNFSDVILAKRVGSTFTWTTVEEGAHGLKANNLAWAAEQPQDFAPLLRRWKEKTDAK